MIKNEKVNANFIATKQTDRVLSVVVAILLGTFFVFGIGFSVVWPLARPLVVWGGCQKLLESPRAETLLNFFTALIWCVFIRTLNTFQFRRSLRNGGLAQVGSKMPKLRRVYRCPSHIRIPLFGARDGWVPGSHGGIRSARWGAKDSGCQNSSR